MSRKPVCIDWKAEPLEQVNTQTTTTVVTTTKDPSRNKVQLNLADNRLNQQDRHELQAFDDVRMGKRFDVDGCGCCPVSVAETICDSPNVAKELIRFQALNAGKCLHDNAGFDSCDHFEESDVCNILFNNLLKPYAANWAVWSKIAEKEGKSADTTVQGQLTDVFLKEEKIRAELWNSLYYPKLKTNERGFLVDNSSPANHQRHKAQYNAVCDVLYQQGLLLTFRH